jgi:hypothetical protein
MNQQRDTISSIKGRKLSIKLYFVFGEEKQ